jgi:DNA mismatch repair protein MutL
MGNIQVLDEHLTNQIAAGEVVERPASVVKELVENSIDAGATRVQVMIEEGGISFIQVSDNGSGMDREDAVLAFSRHATSKIKRERDLYSIRTLGFRGEALPSIASVARVELVTTKDPSQLATKVNIAGGDIEAVEETSRSKGTDVMVRDLFYNTPARLKYLKTVNTEVSHVADVLGRLAFAHPEISFSLTHNRRKLFQTAGDGNLKHVLLSIYGKQVAGQAVSIEGSDMDFRVYGWITKPEITRSNRSYLTIILNGRYVRSLPITQAILRAYGTLLPTGRFPVGVLHLEMDAQLLDVNVHPSKLEARLSKEKECCRLVEETVRQALQKERLVATPKAESAVKKPEYKQETFQWNQAKRPAVNPYPSDRPDPSWKLRESPMSLVKKEEPVKKEEEKETDPAPVFPDPSPSQSKPEPKDSKYQSALSAWSEQNTPRGEEKATLSAPPVSEEAAAEEPEAEANGEDRLPFMTPLAQVHGTYIVAQSEDGFFLLDQHAAHERIYYEIYSKKLGEANHHQYSLLIPMTIECTPAEAEILNMHLDYLNQWGLEMEPFGGTTFVIRAYPAWFPKEDPQQLIHEIIDWLKENGKVETAQLRDATAKMMSCKAAIKANRYLLKEEMEELLNQLSRCENPFTCPHGRPIFVHFSTYELEKMFKRVM